MILSAMAVSGGIYALTGSLAGLIAGLLGIGGGIILVPALLFIFKHNSDIPPSLIMHMAAGTSLAVMFLTSQASTRAHYRLNGILWNVYRRLCPGLILGTISGVYTASHLTTQLLQVLFALFLILVGIKMIFSKPAVSTNYTFPKLWINTLISFLIGFSSGLLGIGGGTLMIPYLNFCGVDIRKTIAISALTTMTIALLGAVTFMMAGWGETGLPLYSTGFIYWPAVIYLALVSSLFAPLGAKMTYIISSKQLKFGFVILLFIVAIDLLL